MNRYRHKSSGDTKILEEQLHTEEDIQSQQQKDKEDTVTQEPVSLGMMDMDVEEGPGGVVVTQEPTTLNLSSAVQDA